MILLDRADNITPKGAYPLVILSTIILVVLTTVFAATLPLFLDEAVSLNESQQSTPRDVVHVIQTWDQGKPPLYFLFLHYWLKLFPIAEIYLRLPSIIFAGLSIVPLFLTGKALVGARAAALSCALLAINPEFIFVSSWGRMYSLFFLLTLVGSYSLYCMVHSANRFLASTCYLVSLVCLLYLHNFAVLVLAVHLAYVMLCNRSALAGMLLVLLMAVTAYLPWLSVAYGQFISITHETSAISWISSPTVLNLLGVFKHLAGSVLLAVLFLPFAILAMLRSWSILDKTSSAGTRPTSRGAHDIRFALIWIGLPVSLTFGFSWTVRPIYAFHYLLFILPPFLWLVAAGVEDLRAKLGRVIVPAFVGVTIVFSAASLYGIAFDDRRPDWRGIAKYVASHRANEEIVLVEDPAQRLPYGYYDRAGEVYGVERGFLRKVWFEGWEAFPDAGPEKVWVVAEKASLVETGFASVAEYGLFGVYRIPRGGLELHLRGLSRGFP